MQIGPETVMTTLYTAKKYAVPALVQCFAALQFNGAADRGILYYLFSSVADPDPGSGIGCFLTPGSGIPDPGSQDHLKAF